MLKIVDLSVLFYCLQRFVPEVWFMLLIVRR